MSLARARRFMGDVFVVAVGVCRIGCEVARERPTASCCGFCSLLVFVLLLCVSALQSVFDLCIRHSPFIVLNSTPILYHEICYNI